MKRKSNNSCIMVFIYLIIILLLCAISMYVFIFLILAKIIVWLLTKVYHFYKTNISLPKENVTSSTKQSKTSTNICLPEENIASSTEQKEINYKNKGRIERRVLSEIDIEKFAIECNSYL